MRAFDLAGPLPRGTVVLEASAGTGKTYTIAGLVVRYLAEGFARVDQLLVVTFGRGATTELRTRVRRRLLAVRDALADPATAVDSEDAVTALLSRGSREEVTARVERLNRALAAFDTATVATVHEFCLAVLSGLGTAGPDEGPGALVDDLRELSAEVADDLYLRAGGRPDGLPGFTIADAHRIAAAAVQDRDARLLPVPEPGTTEQGPRRAAFAAAVRREVAARADRNRLLDFDGLLLRTRDALTDPVSGPVACGRLADRYRVVLVDEFQDTDPVQWEVLRRAFDGTRDLVLIGDPKQSIYAFRGADVRAYLAARDAAGTQVASLSVNHRSDPGVLDALGRLFRGAALGDAGITVAPVRAGREGSRVEPAETPVRLRLLARERHRAASLSQKGLVTVGPARAAVAADVAEQVLGLLAGGRGLRTPQGVRPLGPRDVCVLVRTRVQADLVAAALDAVKVENLVSVLDSVFRQPAATEWLLLLEALEQPHRSGVVRRLALSCWVGATGEQLDGVAGERLTEQLTEQLRGWAEVLSGSGVAGLWSAVAVTREVTVRLLGRVGGERLLTDLRHLTEVLNTEGAAGRGLLGLLSWLRDRIEQAAGDAADLERARRLDTEAPAVQVMTVHAAKGLEWPVVLVPYGWDVTVPGTREQLPRGHDADGRTLHVGGERDPGYRDACARQAAEDAGEELRLLYVAVTRAASLLLLWWQAGTNTPHSPLHRLLFGDRVDEIPVRVEVPDDDVAAARVRALGLTVEPVTDGGLSPTDPPGEPTGTLRLARLTREPDLQWRRTSYTALTREAHEQPGVTSEPDLEVKQDEPPDLDVWVDRPAGGPDRAGVASPMADLPGGAAFGTLVHEVLEAADLTRPDLPAELTRVAAEQLHLVGGPVGPDQLAAALLPAVHTPLGPLAGGLRLVDVAPTDRVAELGFELPLGGGDVPTATAPRLGALADLLRRHLPADDPVRPYVERVTALGDPELRGYLVGAIDLVLRAGDSYLVVDYKTNVLGTRDAPLTSWHYRREALDAAVLAAHYPLQALLYSVALHRFLRWRQPGYDPQAHLGGVLYLFLRGMTGDGSEAGVWSWRPPAALVVELSDLLAGR